MTKMVQGRFTLDLLELPAGEFVKLSDALELALYGGIRSIRDEDLVPRSAIADGMFLGTDSGTLLPETDWGWIVGPKEIDVARPGAVLFGVEDNSEPDAIETAAREQWYQARLKRHELVKEEQAKQAEMLGIPASDRPALSPPRPHDPAGINPFWQAEIMRKREQFFASLNVAARTGKVRFKGTPVEGGWITDPSTYGSVPQDIPAAYFVEERGFDEELNCIDAAGASAPGPGHEDTPSEAGAVSYRDVVVERSDYLRFLRSSYPTVLNPKTAQERLSVGEAIRRLVPVLSQCSDLTKADAAKIVGWPLRSRRFENEIWPKARDHAGLPPTAPGGRKPKSTQP